MWSLRIRVLKLCSKPQATRQAHLALSEKCSKVVDDQDVYVYKA